MKTISVIIPSYNEEGNLFKIRDEINDVFILMSNYNYEIIFVNDGSNDNTQSFLEEISNQYDNVKFIEFSRNFGHQNAVKAGLDFAKGDAVISMDADLQHPPKVIPQLIKKWEEGYEIVYTIREYADNISYFKKKTSNLFYSIISKLSDVNIEKGSSDFRLLDASVVNILKESKEIDIFFRGLVKWIGFKSFSINFEASDRFSGESKYNMSKMIKLAFTGITAFSIKPLYVAVYLGFLFSIITPILYIIYVVCAFYSDTEISGWASLIMTVVFFGGLQLVILGILGIYIGKIFKQIKERPNYIIRSKNI